VTTFGHLPSTSTVYAEEGTAAHELANFCLVNGCDAVDCMGAQFNGFDVTQEMVDAVQVFLDKCREYMGEGWTYFIEQRFSLQELDPPAPMFGTADFAAYNAELGLLVIIDLKYGKGIVVSATGNPQLRYYALGVFYSLPGNPPIDRIMMVIVQPRTMRGEAIKEDTIDLITLLDWSLALMDRARLALSGNGGMCAGPHCKFCKGSGRCATEAAAAIEAAQDAFANAPILEGVIVTDDELIALAMEGPSSIAKAIGPPSDSLPKAQPDKALAPYQPNLPEKIVSPDIRTLTPAQISRYLLQADMVEAWITALRKAAHDMIQSGIEIPEFKLVDKKPTARWKNPDTAVEVLTGKLRVPRNLLFTEPELISPAQARDLAVKIIREHQPKAKKKDVLDIVLDVLTPEIGSGSSGPTLVHVSDPRPPIAGAADEFDCVPAPMEPQDQISP
jgi:hypothetical protein